MKHHGCYSHWGMKWRLTPMDILIHIPWQKQTENISMWSRLRMVRADSSSHQRMTKSLSLMLIRTKHKNTSAASAQIRENQKKQSHTKVFDITLCKQKTANQLWVYIFQKMQTNFVKVEDRFLCINKPFCLLELTLLGIKVDTISIASVCLVWN